MENKYYLFDVSIVMDPPDKNAVLKISIWWKIKRFINRVIKLIKGYK